LVSSNDLSKYEIHFRDGQVIECTEIGRSSTKSSNIINSFRVQNAGSYFHLHLNKVSAINFETVKEKTITADVVLLSGKHKSFRIILDNCLYRIGDQTRFLSLASIKKLRLINQ
jgi:hypothetical protein